MRFVHRTARVEAVGLVVSIVVVAAAASGLSCEAERRGRPVEPAPLPVMASALAPGPASDEPRKIEPIASPGCVLDAHPLGSDSSAKRALRAVRIVVRREAVSAAGDAAVVTFKHRSAKFAMPVGSEAAAGVVAEEQGVRLAGFVARAEIPLFVRPSRKLAGGVLTTTPETPLELVGVENDALRVHVPTSGLLVLAAGLADETIPCADVGASPFEKPTPAKGKAIGLDIGKGLEISSAPDEAPKATLRFGGAIAAPAIDAIEISRKGKLAFVEIPSPEGVLAGWVAITQVHAPKRHDAEPAGSPAPKPTPPVKDGDAAKPALFECKAPLELAVPERVGEAHALVWIGTVEPETAFELDDDPKHAPPSDAWRAVRVRNVTSNVPVLVRSGSFDACTKRL